MKHFYLLVALQLLGLASFSQTTDLLISEYGEGNSNNSKYIEIYNGTGADVDLSDYDIRKAMNGDPWNGTVYHFTTSTLAHNSTIIIANNTTDVPNADEYDTFASWNGNDAVGLFKNGNLLDIIGEENDDPGTGWDVAGVSNATANHKLVRKADTCSPNTNWDESRGTTEMNSEWTVSNYDTGEAQSGHTNSCSTGLVCGLTISATSMICDDIRSQDDTVTYTIDFTDGNNGDDYTVTSSSGTVGGDNPTTVATGSIVITGLLENEQFTVTFENTTTACTTPINELTPFCGSPILIAGIGDGNYTGGTPKFVELYVNDDVDDLSMYELAVYSNGNSASNDEFNLSTYFGNSAVAGQRLFLYNQTTNTTSFEDLFSCEDNFNEVMHTYKSSAISFNGDDVIALRETTNSSIIDVFGEIGVNGTGTAWEYTDGWAYRIDDRQATSTFDASDWTIETNVFPSDQSENNCDLQFPYPFGTLAVPVEFLDFSALKTIGGIALSWQTLSEQSVAYFEIEESINGQTFYPVRTITAIGTSNRLQHYSAILPYHGDRYYRIKVVSTDVSQPHYSNIIQVVDDEHTQSIVVYQPITQTLTISSMNQPISIVSILGEVVYQTENQQTIQLQTNQFATGVYIIKVGAETHKISIY